MKTSLLNAPRTLTLGGAEASHTIVPGLKSAAREKIGCRARRENADICIVNRFAVVVGQLDVARHIRPVTFNNVFKRGHAARGSIHPLHARAEITQARAADVARGPDDRDSGTGEVDPEFSCNGFNGPHDYCGGQGIARCDFDVVVFARSSLPALVKQSR